MAWIPLSDGVWIMKVDSKISIAAIGEWNTKSSLHWQGFPAFLLLFVPSKMDHREEVRLSKTISYILRHGAVKEKLTVRRDGYIKVFDLVSCVRALHSIHSFSLCLSSSSPAPNSKGWLSINCGTLWKIATSNATASFVNKMCGTFGRTRAIPCARWTMSNWHPSPRRWPPWSMARRWTTGHWFNSRDSLAWIGTTSISPWVCRAR